MLTIIACSGAGSLGHVSDIAKAGPQHRAAAQPKPKIKRVSGNPRVKKRLRRELYVYAGFDIRQRKKCAT